jgi:hypothetical protein
MEVIEAIDEESIKEQTRLAAIEWVRKNTTDQFARGGDYVNAFIAGVEWSKKQQVPTELTPPRWAARREEL